MSKANYLWIAVLLAAGYALAEESDESADEQADEMSVTAAAELPTLDPGQPKTLSGMSILGNEEAPKALVIVPWKTSELGADLSLSNTLDDRARPVDRDVFMRELSYYELRSGN